MDTPQNELNATTGEREGTLVRHGLSTDAKPGDIKAALKAMGALSIVNFPADSTQFEFSGRMRQLVMTPSPENYELARHALEHSLSYPKNLIDTESAPGKIIVNDTQNFIRSLNNAATGLDLSTIERGGIEI